MKKGRLGNPNRIDQLTAIVLAALVVVWIAAYAVILIKYGVRRG
jgi:hypothetical protein